MSASSKQVVALLVDDLALIVGHIVVLEQLLADVEVAPLDLALRLLDGIGHHAVLDGLALLHAQGLHEVLHAVRGEDAHQAVFQGQVEARHAGVPLAARRDRAAGCRYGAIRGVRYRRCAGRRPR
jgi:hypothetical protein